MRLSWVIVFGSAAALGACSVAQVDGNDTENGGIQPGPSPTATDDGTATTSQGPVYTDTAPVLSSDAPVDTHPVPTPSDSTPLDSGPQDTEPRDTGSFDSGDTGTPVPTDTPASDPPMDTGGQNHCLSGWRDTPEGEDCLSQTQGDRAVCAWMLDCMIAENCASVDACTGNATDVCDKGMGTAWRPYVTAVWDALCTGTGSQACPEDVATRWVCAAVTPDQCGGWGGVKHPEYTCPADKVCCNY